jgi:hypothetical protein
MRIAFALLLAACAPAATHKGSAFSTLPSIRPGPNEAFAEISFVAVYGQETTALKASYVHELLTGDLQSLLDATHDAAASTFPPRVLVVRPGQHTWSVRAEHVESAQAVAVGSRGGVYGAALEQVVSVCEASTSAAFEPGRKNVLTFDLSAPGKCTLTASH